MKKIIVILIVLSMILSILVPIIALAEPEDAFLSSGLVLKNLGVIKGDSEGNLMLEDTLRRQDMVVLMSRLYKEEDKARTFLIKPKFTDIIDSHAFYHPYIGWAVDKGLIKGMGDNTFGIDRYVTNQEFMVVLLRVLGYEEESKLWNSIPELAAKIGISVGIDAKPSDKLTRGQMALMTVNVLKLTSKGSSMTLAEKLGLSIE